MTTSTPLTAPATSAGSDPTPAGPWDAPTKGSIEQVALALFIAVPFLALVAAVPVAWGGLLGWHDVVIALVAYAITGHGITVGFHRYFTHGSFQARRGLRIALAVAGSAAVQGPVIRWVADHRRHHKFSDRDGDPHSPWRFGTSVGALSKGLLYAHMGWLFAPEHTNPRMYVPDLLADRDIRRISAFFPLITVASLSLPALAGGLWAGSWTGALTAFFWASLVRVSLLHHVTWSINSICHTVGDRPFVSRDKSANVWWLAIASMGESWHNLHHADPTCARHGVLHGQIDSSARVIWLFEKVRLVTAVRWPVPSRLAARRAA